MRMAGSIGTRGIRLGGRDWQLAGPAEDSFFAHADGHVAGMEALAAVAASVLPPDGVVLDVGANIGLSALALAPLLPRGRILALEPSPRTVAALRRTVALNGLRGPRRGRGRGGRRHAPARPPSTPPGIPPGRI